MFHAMMRGVKKNVYMYIYIYIISGHVQKKKLKHICTSQSQVFAAVYTCIWNNLFDSIYNLAQHMPAQCSFPGPNLSKVIHARFGHVQSQVHGVVDISIYKRYVWMHVGQIPITLVVKVSKLLASNLILLHGDKKWHGKLVIPCMEEILHQLIDGLSHYLKGFNHPRWCRISTIAIQRSNYGPSPWVTAAIWQIASWATAHWACSLGKSSIIVVG